MRANVVKDASGNEYTVRNINGAYWMMENLRADSFIDNGVLNHYIYNDSVNTEMYGFLYSFNAMKSDNEVIKNYRVPTLDELVDVINSYNTIEEFVLDFNVLPGGMYDFTLVEQWVGETACFLTITNGLPKVVYIDITNNTYKIGNFHPSDAVSIRLIKSN